MSGARGVPVHDHKRRRISSANLSQPAETRHSEILGIAYPSHRITQPRRTSIAHLISSPSPPHWTQASTSGTPVPGRNEHKMEGDDKGGSTGSDSGTPGSITSVVLSQGSGSEPHSDWVFTLEVIQQPQRARACGFGDKDRRPLSPPPIIRLRVHTSSGEPVDPSHVTIQFLILVADLWSSDGTQERNTVMHPGSQVVRGPTIESQAGPSKSEPWSTSQSSYPPRHQGDFRYSFPMLASSPSRSQDSESSRQRQPHPRDISGWSPPRTADSQPALAKPAAILPASVSGSRPVTAPAHSPRMSLDRDAFHRADPRQSTSSSITSPARATFQPPPTPTSSYSPSRPATSYSRPHTSYLPIPSHLRLPVEGTRPNLPSLSAVDLSPSSSMIEHPDMAVRPTTGSSIDRPRTATSAMSGFSGRPSTAGARPSTGSTFPLPTTPTQLPVTSTYPSMQSSPYVESFADYGEPSRIQIGASATATPNYSRVLVGALGCICQRLLDENGQPELFFFAHDLGVRTEGTFRLRFRLSNLTSLMQASDPTRREPNLAEVFSEPFAVYSAKKFPGVIPTTALTRVFARQNVRLPTRQRRRGRARSEGDSGDDTA